MSFRDVKNVEKLGKFHVKFNFKNSNNRNLPLIVASLPILPKHFYEKNDFSKSSLTIPIGSGPYKIKDFIANRYVVYERNKIIGARIYQSILGAIILIKLSLIIIAITMF